MISLFRGYNQNSIEIIFLAKEPRYDPPVPLVLFKIVYLDKGALSPPATREQPLIAVAPELDVLALAWLADPLTPPPATTC